MSVFIFINKTKAKIIQTAGYKIFLTMRTRNMRLLGAIRFELEIYLYTRRFWIRLLNEKTS